MKDLQQAKREGYDRVKQFNTDNAADVGTIPEYAQEQTNLDAAVGKIDAAAVKQVVQTEGSTDTSTGLKRTMSNTVIKYCLRGKVKAKQLGNTDLAKSLTHGYTYIFNAAKEDALTRARALRKVLNDAMTAGVLTNITGGNITEIDGTITAYDASKEVTRNKVIAGKSAGTDMLPKPFHDADDACHNMIDLFRSYFGDTKPDEMEALELSFEPMPHGEGHNNLGFDLIDQNGDGFGGLTVQLFDLQNQTVVNKYAVSDLTGAAEIHEVHLQQYVAEISGPNVATTRTRPITAKRSQTVVTHLQLLRQ